MARVVMDEWLAKNLKDAAGAVELVDENGRVVGVYAPSKRWVAPPGCEPPFTDEEMDELSKVRTGRPLADIIRDLERKYGKP